MVDRTRSTSLEARLAFVVGRFNRRLLGATGGLSHGLLSALSTVAKRGPIRMAELAVIELVSAPSITRVVAELESRGLVERSDDPDDGRAFLIQVTPAGEDALVRARDARAEVVSSMLDGLDADQIAAIDSAIPALEAALGDG
ncbi:MarR family winged helix-turn-helix transcriptional regulator [Amnibacterium flavum]|uniref:MarR family winged helix-turn-helix transcriptional regulator n=1 Tax=Amnibacterium flavum TaxID=2173173 RepID=UPI0014040C08|nr:MarR family transcriptional regulator [Amnibacterium flavum]